MKRLELRQKDKARPDECWEIYDEDGTCVLGGCGCCGSPFTNDLETLRAMIEAYNATVDGVEKVA